MDVLDENFLSLVEVAEAAAKKRKMDGAAAAAGYCEGSYTAALRGSKSISWQQQNAVDLKSTPKTTASNTVDGNACFKCGKPGHWARDCTGVGGGAGDGPRNPAVATAEKQCPCGAGPCLVLTANTERNRGRTFHRCPIREENGGCAFFEWCDNSAPNNLSSSVVPNLPCPCGAGACIVLTAKTGENMGQQFYCCPAKQEASCGFFKWCSEHNPVISPPTGSKRVYSTLNDGGSPSCGGRNGSCFKCGEEGHWARDCSKPSTASDLGGGQSDSSNACYKCGKAGHWARDCPSQQANISDRSKPSADSYLGGSGKSDSSNACYKCGKAGHWARDCPSQQANVSTGSRKTASVRSSHGYHCK